MKRDAEAPTRAGRLAAQGLSRRADSVALACRRMLALQAQDFTQARWALAVRTEGATLEHVSQAFAARELVRAWTLRGTLHVMPAEELPWMIALLGGRNLQRAAGRLRQLEISELDLRAARKLVERVLRGRTLSRDELFAQLAAAGQSVEGQRGVHLLFGLTQQGVLCQAGEAFALAEEWIVRPRALQGEEALAELATRYRLGHGAATLEDFVFWTGLTKRDAERGWAASVAAPPETAAIPKALLLPGFDEYLLGYADRSTCIDAAELPRVVPGGNGVFLPMLVLDGRVRGTWRRRVEAKRVTLSIAPFQAPSEAEVRAIEEAARAYGAFVGAPAVVKLEA